MKLALHQVWDVLAHPCAKYIYFFIMIEENVLTNGKSNMCTHHNFDLEYVWCWAVLAGV